MKNTQEKKKNIDNMSPIEIGKYLNIGNHNHPIIMKHLEGYDVHYSEEIRYYLDRRYRFERFKTFDKAIKFYKMICGGEVSAEKRMMKNMDDEKYEIDKEASE